MTVDDSCCDRKLSRHRLGGGAAATQAAAMSLNIQPQTKSERGLGHIEAWPAPILFKSAGALLACIVQKPLPDVLPDCVGPVKTDRVNRLDFHCAVAAPAGD